MRVRALQTVRSTFFNDYADIHSHNAPVEENKHHGRCVLGRGSGRGELGVGSVIEIWIESRVESLMR